MDESEEEDDGSGEAEGGAWYGDAVDGWPMLQCEACGEYAELDLGPRPEGPERAHYGERAVLPASISQHLRAYQLEGVKWLWRQYSSGCGGVLGDEMGLGKTVQICAFLNAVLGKSATRADCERTFPLPEQGAIQVLLVVPKSTIGNWQRELRTWGCFRLTTCHGPRKEEAIETALARECEILLTTAATLKSCAADLQRVPFAISVFDEAHTIGKPGGKMREAAIEVTSAIDVTSNTPRHPARRHACRYCLTGTPMSNKHEELWALFDFASDGRVGTKKDFTAYYSHTLKQGQRRQASAAEQNKRTERQNQLAQLTGKWMIQRSKSVLSGQMPRKIDQVVFCRLAARQEETYARVLKSADYQMLLHMDTRPCVVCGADAKTKECHPLGDPDEALRGVLIRHHHPDGEPCTRCPACIGLPALTQLLKLSNHLELIKPDPQAPSCTGPTPRPPGPRPAALGRTAGPVCAGAGHGGVHQAG